MMLQDTETFIRSAHTYIRVLSDCRGIKTVKHAVEEGALLLPKKRQQFSLGDKTKEHTCSM